MSDDYRRNCPRCESRATAFIGAQDIGSIERHMYVCCECGLIFGITDPTKYKYGLTQYYEERLEELESDADK